MSGAAPEKCALNFYYFLLCDEALATVAASQALKILKKMTAKFPEANKDVVLVRALLSTYRKIKRKIGSSKFGTQSVSKSEWLNPKPELFSRWKEYMNKSEGQTDDVLVLRYILDFPTQVIAEAMDIPEGTVLFRIGRGLEVLSKR